MKACNIKQAACQAVVCGIMCLQASCKLLVYRTRLSCSQIPHLIYGLRHQQRLLIN